MKNDMRDELEEIAEAIANGEEEVEAEHMSATHVPAGEVLNIIDSLDYEDLKRLCRTLLQLAEQMGGVVAFIDHKAQAAPPRKLDS